MRSFLKFIQPYHLLAVLLAHSLGSGIARYLGADVDWILFSLGTFSVLILPVAAQVLQEYFALPSRPLESGETRAQRERWRVQLLQGAFALLVLSVAAIVALILMASITISATFLYGLVLVLLIGTSIPPFQFSSKGYGELFVAFCYATILPAFAFLLQENEFNRILVLISFPLTLLAITWLLAMNFSTFSADRKAGRLSLLLRLTWQGAIPIHHVLVLLSFLLFSASPFFGLSWAILWPVFLAMPFYVLEIAWLQRIASGGKPVWKLFNTLAPAAYLLVLYLLTLSFWLR